MHVHVLLTTGCLVSDLERSCLWLLHTLKRPVLCPFQLCPHRPPIADSTGPHERRYEVRVGGVGAGCGVCVGGVCGWGGGGGGSGREGE